MAQNRRALLEKVAFRTRIFWFLFLLLHLGQTKCDTFKIHAICSGYEHVRVSVCKRLWLHLFHLRKVPKAQKIPMTYDRAVVGSEQAHFLWNRSVWLKDIRLLFEIVVICSDLVFILFAHDYLYFLRRSCSCLRIKSAFLEIVAFWFKNIQIWVKITEFGSESVCYIWYRCNKLRLWALHLKELQLAQRRRDLV